MSIIKNIEEYYLNIINNKWILSEYFFNGHLINNDICETIKLMLPVSLVVYEGRLKCFCTF